MQIGFIGLGKMGFSMVARLLEHGHQPVAFDREAAARERTATAGANVVDSLEGLVSALAPPRAVWVMVPAGSPTEAVVSALVPLLARGDAIVDGGNSDFRDDIRRAAQVAAVGLDYVDAGTSGGVWGLQEGYCLMVGGPAAACQRLEPVFRALAPADGYLRVGEAGAGHFVKMVHNGIEYGLMQAYAEGFELLHRGPYPVDLAAVARLWNHGSVVRSWLLELAAGALGDDPDLSKIRGYVEDSGEGRWMLREGIERAVPLPALAAAVFARFRSRQDDPFSGRLLAALRHQFGGHAVKPSGADDPS